MPASMAATASGVSALLMSTPVTSPTKTGWIWRIESGMTLASGRVGLVPSIPAASDRDNPFRALARLHENALRSHPSPLDAEWSKHQNKQNKDAGRWVVS